MIRETVSRSIQKQIPVHSQSQIHVYESGMRTCRTLHSGAASFLWTYGAASVPRAYGDDCGVNFHFAQRSHPTDGRLAEQRF